MKNLRLKTGYFLNSAWKLIQRKGLACPSCGALKSTKVERKYLVTSLMRCNSCKLLFRIPTTSPTENEKFYQRAFQRGFTTEMPSLAALSKLKSDNFQNTEKNYTHYINILNNLVLNKFAKILDFGCSWGYGSWQFKQAGYDVQSFEISRARCEYAIKYMNVDATWNLDDLRGPFDVFFSSHVIEHVPSVREIISLAEKLLRPEGYFVAFTPNGSNAYRKLSPSSWKHAWGFVHPNMLDEEYYERTFRNTSFIIGSNPYNTNAIMKWAQEEAGCSLKQKVLPLGGNELLCIAKLPSQ